MSESARAVPKSEKSGEFQRTSSLLVDQEELINTLRTRLGDVIVGSVDKLTSPPHDRGIHVTELNDHLVKNNDAIREIIADLAI